MELPPSSSQIGSFPQVGMKKFKKMELPPSSSQIGSFPQVGMKKFKKWNHNLVLVKLDHFPR